MAVRLLVASGNPGKLAELRRMLDVPGLEVVGPDEAGVAVEVEESGATYAENAALKARAWSEAAGCLALADDSGLEVDALAGRPGVRTARYGGPGLDDAGRYRKLLAELEGVPPERRTARFRAVVAIAGPGTGVELFEGVLEGRIAAAPRGEGGFGYDPVFELGDGRTVAELSREEKDPISHRGLAMAKARAWLEVFVRGQTPA